MEMLGSRHLRKYESMKKITAWINQAFPLDHIFNFFVGCIMPLVYLYIIPSSDSNKKLCWIYCILLFLLVGFIIQYINRHKRSRSNSVTGSAWMPLGILLSSVICGLCNLVTIRICIMAVSISIMSLLFDYLAST